MRFLALILALLLNFGIGAFLLYSHHQQEMRIGAQASQAAVSVNASLLSDYLPPKLVSIEERRALQRSLNDRLILSHDSLRKIEQRIVARQHQREKVMAEQEAQLKEAARIEREKRAHLAKREQRSAKREQKRESRVMSDSSIDPSSRAEGESTQGRNSVPLANGASSGAAMVEASLNGLIEQCYPAISRRRGEEGVARLSLSIGTRNEGVKVNLVQSTGYSRLDQCAIDAVRRATEQPSFKRMMEQGALPQGEIHLRPIEFRLR